MRYDKSPLGPLSATRIGFEHLSICALLLNVGSCNPSKDQTFQPLVIGYQYLSLNNRHRSLKASSLTLAELISLQSLLIYIILLPLAVAPIIVSTSLSNRWNNSNTSLLYFMKYCTISLDLESISPNVYVLPVISDGVLNGPLTSTYH